jgi:hypothetical protein
MRELSQEGYFVDRVNWNPQFESGVRIFCHSRPKICDIPQGWNQIIIWLTIYSRNKNGLLSICVRSSFLKFKIKNVSSWTNLQPYLHFALLFRPQLRVKIPEKALNAPFRNRAMQETRNSTSNDWTQHDPRPGASVHGHIQIDDDRDRNWDRSKLRTFQFFFNILESSLCIFYSFLFTYPSISSRVARLFKSCGVFSKLSMLRPGRATRRSEL